MTLLLGIDLGTSYFKVGLFDVAGTLRGLAREPVNKTVPAPGRCELAVEDFWAALRRGLAAALAQAGATPGDIAGVSYSSQASTFLLLDRSDQPLTPMIVWVDSRGDPVDASLSAFAKTEVFRDTVGFEGISGQTAVAKWRWFMRHEPELWAKAHRVMTISDYLAFALTGERVGDASTVAFLALYDLAHARWWPAALQEFGIEEERLSRPLCPGAPSGRTATRASDLLGLPAGIPFSVGALDHHAAAIGSGLGRLADLSISTGTVLAALSLVDTPSAQAGCYHGRHVDGARFWRLAFDPNGAGQLEDYQRKAAPDQTIEHLLLLAAEVAPGVAWKTGLPAGHGAAVRGVLERVAATHRELVHRVLGAGSGAKEVRSVVATGGGARSPLWLQINADMLGLPVVTPACPERA
ncbi:MAG: FGGY-family carbohydrate kinase, partial [Verrucomicrobia bacterium]|nr:FGGY-family carbohydrate kinase [Verrucomicrobiota bacterium]